MHLNRTDKGDFSASAYEIGISLDDPDDAMFTQYRTGTLDRAKRKELVLDVIKRLIDNVANVFIQAPFRNWVWTNRIKNFDPKSGLFSNYRHINVWIDPQ